MPATSGSIAPSPYPKPSMYSIGSARLPSIDGMASLLHTLRLRCHTCTKRRLGCGSDQIVAGVIAQSVAQVAPGQAQEHVFEIGGAMQVTKFRPLLKVAQQRF